METHNIDSFFKNTVERTATFYDSEANRAKENIWKNIQSNKQNHRRIILFRSVVAACILLFISTSVISISFINVKKSMKALVEANNTLTKSNSVNNQNALSQNHLSNVAKATLKDTVFIEKEIIVSKPVVVTKHVTDTVYVREIIYAEKELAPELATVNENNTLTNSADQKKADSFKTEIIITNNRQTKPGNRKKLQFKFGGNIDQTSNGTLAFTTKL